MSEANKFKNHKRTDEELVCDCGHLYHKHMRKYDSKTRTHSFGNLGPCNICKCQAYKDVTIKTKYQKQVDDAIHATGPNTTKLESKLEKPNTPKYLAAAAEDSQGAFLHALRNINRANPQPVEESQAPPAKDKSNGIVGICQHGEFATKCRDCKLSLAADGLAEALRKWQSALGTLKSADPVFLNAYTDTITALATYEKAKRE